jgi:hypothetical protein
MATGDPKINGYVAPLHGQCRFSTQRQIRDNPEGKKSTSISRFTLDL